MSATAFAALFSNLSEALSSRRPLYLCTGDTPEQESLFLVIEFRLSSAGVLSCVCQPVDNEGRAKNEPLRHALLVSSEQIRAGEVPLLERATVERRSGTDGSKWCRLVLSDLGTH